jgi:hypothetical protein
LSVRYNGIIIYNVLISLILHFFHHGGLLPGCPKPRCSPDGICRGSQFRFISMLILLIILILFFVGAFPAWPHSRNWGYGPSGGLGTLLVVLLILYLLHVI